MINPQDRLAVEYWLRQPEDLERREDLRARILSYLRDNLEFLFVSNDSGPTDEVICVAFDQDNKHVELDPPFTPHEAWKAHWAWELSVSKRGPFVTCETVSFSPGDNNAYCRDVKHDVIVRPRPVEWTKRLASALDLTYLDAKALQAWEVNYEDMDPTFYLDRDSGRLPTASQVLFYE